EVTEGDRDDESQQTAQGADGESARSEGKKPGVELGHEPRENAHGAGKHSGTERPRPEGPQKKDADAQDQQRPQACHNLPFPTSSRVMRCFSSPGGHCYLRTRCLLPPNRTVSIGSRVSPDQPTCVESRTTTAG